MLGVSAWFCGPPIIDNLAADPPTCGCLVLGRARETTPVELTVHGLGTHVGIGKLVVDGTECPQGRW